MSPILFWIIIIIIIIIFSLLMEHWYNGPKTPLTHSMAGQIIVITGGSRGIGWEAAKDLLKQGAKIIFGNRTIKNTEEKINTLPEKLKSNCFSFPLDLENYDSIKKFAENIIKKFKKIDILINNAASCFIDFTLINGIEKTFLTNHVGHVILTSLLIDNFNDYGRIITVSTTKYQRVWKSTFNKFTDSKNVDFSWTKSVYEWMRFYIVSKLADIHHAQYLTEIINKKKLKLKSVCLHPGFIDNHFFREIEKKSYYWAIRDFLQTPFRFCIFKDNEMGAQTHLHCCYMDFEKLKQGGYYRDCHEETLKEIGTLKYAKKMMQFTKEIIVKNNTVKGDQKVMNYFID